jgi:hypothetical protein
MELGADSNWPTKPQLPKDQMHRRSRQWCRGLRRGIEIVPISTRCRPMMAAHTTEPGV